MLFTVTGRALGSRAAVRVDTMEGRQVGSSGLRVSRLGLGTMTWGRDTTDDQARGLLEMFCEAGGTLIVTVFFSIRRYRSSNVSPSGWCSVSG